MPRKQSVPRVSGFAQVLQQTQQLLFNLRKEVLFQEAELSRLKEEETKLSALVGWRATGTGAKAPSLRRGLARIDWGRVLEQLPKQFKASDIHKVREVGGKRSSELFAAVTRWMKAGVVKRQERGSYERVQPSQSRNRRKEA